MKTDSKAMEIAARHGTESGDDKVFDELLEYAIKLEKENEAFRFPTMKKFIKDRKSAEEFIKSRLKVVTMVLNDIAEQTGVVYVVNSEIQCKFLAELGNRIAGGLLNTMKVLSGRYGLANEYWERRAAAVEDEEEKKDCLCCKVNVEHEELTKLLKEQI